MEEDELQSTVLKASLSNPNDPFEMTIIGDAASVGTTTELRGSGKRVKWTAEQLERYAPTLKDMPITLRIDDETGKPSAEHTNVIVGRIKEGFFDKSRNTASYVGQLYKHYFPETLNRLSELYASDKEEDKPETSWEFTPEGLDYLTDEGDNVVTPTDGRFSGLAIIAKGADTGSRITLLASAAKSESAKIPAERSAPPRAGSFEWIGDSIVNHLTASATEDTFVPFTVLETYPDYSVYVENGKYFKLPYTVQGNDIKFSATIEVEPIYQPLGASAAGSTTDPEVTPTPQVEETHNTVDEKELEALKASAAKVPDLETAKQTLETENETLKAENEALKASAKELEDLKAANAAKEEEDRLNTLAASRIADVEKIVPYKDAAQKEEDREAFKSMDEKSFEMIKRTLVAAAEMKGGIAPDARIDPPATREDPDGQAAQILESDEYKALLAARQPSKEDK